MKRTLTWTFIFCAVAIASLIVSRSNQRSTPSPCDTVSAKKVFRMIEAGNLKIGPRGKVDLPSDYQHLSVTKAAYFTKREGIELTLFPLGIGKGGDLSGIVVTNGNILDGYINPGKEIDITMMKRLVLLSPFNPKIIDPSIEGEGYVYVYVTKRIDSGVYEVLNQDS